MIRKIDDTSADAQLQSPSTPTDPEAVTPCVSSTPAPVTAHRSHVGWDPMEVWRRHIDQPRRLRQRANTIDARRRS